MLTSSVAECVMRESQMRVGWRGLLLVGLGVTLGVAITRWVLARERRLSRGDEATVYSQELERMQDA
jgi:hypothetical protein